MPLLYKKCTALTCGGICEPQLPFFNHCYDLSFCSAVEINVVEIGANAIKTIN